MNSLNNSQLIKTLAKKRTANFREDETRLLIQLWGSPQIQNKLNLTHRKAPVMRLIAANMQARGFYRSPDEIKTRIRNLKCLYHRIKRTITSGSGIGTVDPDWPHFKAMDAILGDSNSTINRMQGNASIKDDMDGSEDQFEIKQEIDINDDLDSWNNESGGSDYDDDLTPPPIQEPKITITTAPVKTTIPNNTQHFNITNMGQAGNLQQARTITCTPQTIRPNQQNMTTLPPSIPLPFLILNSLKPANNQQINTQQSILINNHDGQPPNKRKRQDSDDASSFGPALNQLLDVQRQILDVDKQRLEVEKQRLEFDRLVGSQLMNLVPMIGSLIQRFVFPQDDMDKFDMDQMPEDMCDVEMHDPDNDPPPQTMPPRLSERELSNAEDELEKNRNILRNLLNQGLKARMLKEQQEKELKEAEEAAAEGNTEEPTIIVSDKEDEPEKDKDSEKNKEETEKDKVEEIDKDDELDKEDDEEEEEVEDDDESCVLLINENSNETNDN